MINDIKINDWFDKDLIVIDKFGGEEETGFGVVYLLLSPETKKTIALKTFQDQYLGLPEDILKIFIDDFYKEALAWSELKEHPNIVWASPDMIEDRLFIIMEPIFPDKHGKQTLQDYMDGGLDDYTILNWSIQFCSAMEYANENGIQAHGDIKPTNILIDFTNNLLKISDFGLVKLSKNNSLSDFIEKNLESLSNDNFSYTKYSCSGSWQYMAPESFKGIKNVQTDIYSFGWVLYQMLNNGRLPYEFNNNWSSKEWRDFHITYKIPYLSSDFFFIVERCLEKNLNNRYNSFKELKQDLQEIFVSKFNEKPYLPDLGKIDSFSYVSKANSFAIKGFVNEAIFYFEKAIKENSEFFIPRIQYSIRLIEWGLDKESLPHLFKARELFESGKEKSLFEGARVYFNLGHVYQNLKDYPKAIENYKESIKLNPEYKEAYVNLGNIQMDKGNLDEAEKLYDTVLSKDPNFYKALINKCIVNLKKGNLEEFNKCFKQAKKLNNSPELHYCIGNEYASQKDWLNALTEYSEAVTLNPKFAEAHIALLNLYFETNPSLVKQKSEEILKNFSEDNQTKFLLALMFLHYKQYDESLLILNELIVSNSEYKTQALIEKADILNQTGKEHEAIKCYNEVIRLIDDEKMLSELWNSKGYAYSKLRITEKAINCFTKSIKFNSKNIYPLMNQGKIYGDLGNHFIALCFFEDSLKIDENNSKIWFEKAIAHMKLGEYDEALKSCDESLKLSNSELTQSLKNEILRKKSII